MEISLELSVCGKAEVILFRGIKFRRYPESNRVAHKYYYTCSGKFRKQGISTLHREIYKFFFGAIPSNSVVHHKDGNPLNNQISNLELMSEYEHRRMHSNEPVRIEKSRAMGRANIERLTEWSVRTKGRRYVQSNPSQYWKNPEMILKVCPACACEYKVTKPRSGMTVACSARCRKFLLTQRDV